MQLLDYLNACPIILNTRCQLEQDIRNYSRQLSLTDLRFVVRVAEPRDKGTYPCEGSGRVVRGEIHHDIPHHFHQIHRFHQGQKELISIV